MQVIKIESLTNPRIKHLVKLRQRSHRDAHQEMLIEGYRECKRALDQGYKPGAIFFAPELYLKNQNEESLVARTQQAGAALFCCTAPVFHKIAYRDRPDGLLMTGPYLDTSLQHLKLTPNALIVVAVSLEKPGNLGTILRSADAAGADGVIVCESCTDIHNPNVVRASTGTIFSVPIAESSSSEVLEWLAEHEFNVFSASPHASQQHFEADMRGRTAIVVGSEQCGLDDSWLKAAHQQIQIPMAGLADSLNVAAATTILLFEAVRQRISSSKKR